MKITEIKTHILHTQLEEPFYFSHGWVTERNSMIIELRTDEGIVGYGESLCHGQQPPAMSQTIVEHVLKPLVLGKSCFDVEVIWETLYNRTRPYGQGGVVINAISGLDVAIWDALGKYYGQPISNLIGGRYRSEVEAYATGFYRKEGCSYPDDAIMELKRHVGAGFRGVKLKAGFGVETDASYIRAVREVAGPEIKVMCDFNSCYNAAQARKLLYQLRDVDLFFYEELLAPEDIEGYKMLRTLTPSYIAAGEQTFGKFGFREWLSQGALDIIQPDICSCGGITECKKIAAIAQAWNVMLMPHIWGSSIGMAASLQFLASIPPSPISMTPQEPLMEFDTSEHPFKNDLIYGAIAMKDGFVTIPSGPGLGVTVNTDIIKKYEVNIS